MKNIVTFKCDCGVITRTEFVNPPKVGQKIACLSCENIYRLEAMRPSDKEFAEIIRLQERIRNLEKVADELAEIVQWAIDDSTFTYIKEGRAAISELDALKATQ